VCPLVSRIAEVGERRPISRSTASRATSVAVWPGISLDRDSSRERKQTTRGRAVAAKPHARRNAREGCSPVEGVPDRESRRSSRIDGGSDLGGAHEGPLPTRSDIPTLPREGRGLEWVLRQGRPEDGPRARRRKECLPEQRHGSPPVGFGVVKHRALQARRGWQKPSADVARKSTRSGCS
jgi:hypothetical protein